MQPSDPADQPGPDLGPAGDTAAELRVVLLQRASGLEPDDNRARLADVEAYAGRADLVVLPEAYARDFGERGSDLAPYAEPLDGPFVETLRERAGSTGATIVAGMFERPAPDEGDPAKPFNTLACAHPDGGLTTYRKVHLYDSFGYRESDVLTAGPIGTTTVDVAGVRVGLMTCYDLRFPEMARAVVDAGAELLVAPSAWVAGEGKAHHWRTLVTARAIENVCWVAACAQPAPRYTGLSMVVDPLGRTVAEAGEEDGADVAATVRRDDLVAARRTNPSLANRRLR